jgi:hypothetical protein
MRPLKIVAIILGLVFALAGLAFVTSAGFLLHYGGQRDQSGFFTSPDQQVGSYGFALTAPDINGALGPRLERWVPAWGNVDVRIEGRSERPTSLFIGVAPTAGVSVYLSGVDHDKITTIDWRDQSVEYAHVDGTRLPLAPGKQSFWVAKKQGPGLQTLEWKLRPGDWTVVVMNEDGSAPLAATIQVGTRLGILSTLVVALIAGGVALLVGGATLLYFGARRRRRPPTPAYSQAPYQRL